MSTMDLEKCRSGTGRRAWDLETPIALTNTLNVGKVLDAMVDVVIEQSRKDGIEPQSINPVVGECNDCRINHIQKRAIGEKEVREAFAAIRRIRRR